MTRKSKQLVVDLLMEELRVCRLDDASPIEGDPSRDKVAATEFLGRRRTLRALEAEFLELQELEGEALGDLVSIAATAFEMWARGADADPMELLREIASGWETSYFDRKNES